MKKIIVSILSLALIVTFSSCKSDPDSMDGAYGNIDGIYTFSQSSSKVEVTAITYASEMIVLNNTKNILEHSLTDPSVVIEFYESTIKQPEWISEESREKRGEMLQIPEEYLYELSTEALVEAVLAYPFFMDVYAFDNMQIGLDILYNSFNGVRELSKRPDAAMVLLNMYKNEQVVKSDDDINNLFRICNIEILLSQEYIISKMNSEEISDLSNTAYNKYVEKSSSDYYGKSNIIFYDLIGITDVDNKSDLIVLTESILNNT